MVIDEGFNTLDEINTDKLAGFIDYIAQRYKCMLIITHNKDLARIITHHIPLVYNRFECYIRENVENPPKLDEPPQQTALGEPVIAPPIQPNGRYQCPCGAEIMNTEQKIANHKNTASHKKNMEKRGRR
jgi:energy-coupling factor transporter ATP-binding protein EcfA2